MLLIHGFTGSPFSLKPWAAELAAAGYRVSLPRLPGHGTSWQELNQIHWSDWYHCVRRDFEALRTQCDHVFIGGLSMGGSLALRLAADHPQDVAGLVLVNPAVVSADPLFGLAGLLKSVVRSVAGISSDIAKPGVSEHGYDRTPVAAVQTMGDLWRGVIADLPRVEAPLLLFRSLTDHVVPARSSGLILHRVSSRTKVERVLPNSYHVATLDWDADLVFAESRDFVAALSAGQTEGGPQPGAKHAA